MRRRNGAGRPPETDEARDESINVRLTKGEREAFERAGVNVRVVVRAMARGLMTSKTSPDGDLPRAS